jgi:hypothetical protein
MKAILEMEMPETCKDCQLTRTYAVPHKTFLECKYNNKSFIAVTDYTDSRHPDCPLKIVEDNKESNHD